jgi:hypothetical protein
MIKNECKKGKINMKLQNLIHTLTILIISIGFLSHARAVSPPPDGGYPGGNTAEGQAALLSLGTGGYNTAVGFFSLRSDTTGSFNTGIGAGALLSNNGDQNTATGTAALLTNSGSFNTADGSIALFSNMSGNFNSALGQGALTTNTTGGDNTACGAGALFTNSEGSENTAVGFQALNDNTIGNNNTAIGQGAGANHIDGSGNVFIGQGVIGPTSETNHTYIRNINTISVNGGGTDMVTVNLQTGLLGHATSSRRYKEDIQPMNNASEALYQFKPVAYRYKKEIDPTRSAAFGLIAEQVAEVNPDLVARNSQGQPESIHYEMINAMLLNEFLKEHHRVEAQQSKIEEQQKEINGLAAQLREQAALIQQVRMQTQTGDSVPRMIASTP